MIQVFATNPLICILSMARAALLMLAMVALAAAINNGVGRTPAMGWNTWCTESFECTDDYCTQTEVMAVADGTKQRRDII